MIISSYFMHSFSFFSTFHNGTLDSSQLTEFARRVAALSSKTIEFNGNEFQSVKEFIENGLAQNISVETFGYYGQTSICMPRFLRCLRREFLGIHHFHYHSQFLKL